MRMKKPKHTIASFIGTAFTALFLLANTVSAQTQPALQPAQGAQMSSQSDAMPQASAPVVVEVAPVEKAAKKAPQLAVPANATKKQEKQIAKVNAAIAKAVENQAAGEVKAPSKLQKAAAQMTVKKMTRKLDRMGVEKTTEIKDLESKSAAQALDSLTLIGLVLALLGLIFLFVPGVGILGLLFLVIGLVLLLVGVINNA